MITRSEPADPAKVPPEAPRRREGPLLVLAALCGAIVVLGGLVGLQRWTARADEVSTATAAEDESAVATPPSTGSTRPQPAPNPDLNSDSDSDSGPDSDSAGGIDPEQDEQRPVETVACPPQYSEVICEAAAFVQRARGRPFKEFPAIELMEDGPFDQALVEDLERSTEDLLEDERLLKSFGLLPADFDLLESRRSLIESGVVGFYDPSDGRLAVRGQEFDLYGQAILVHELVHAFDDQWFDLGRDNFEDDAARSFLAVIEGNASRVEELWRAELSLEDRALLQDQEMGSLSQEDVERLLSLPEVLLSLQFFPYSDGEVYVSGLARLGGEASVDERLIDPPDSSEQVLHSTGPPQDLVVVDIQTPVVDGPILADGTAGELLIGLWLGERAAYGWGGDRYALWQSDSQTCMRIDLAADSPADLADISDAAQRWVEQDAEQRSLELLQNVDRTLIRVDGCY